MRRKSFVTVNVRDWEYRRYWRKGMTADIEVWHSGRLLPRPPRRLPASTIETDYCLAHRARIYADLACQHCGERPAPRIVVHMDEAGAAR